MLYPVGAFLMVVVGLVLVIASSNLATLLLAKASSRQKDFAIRLALGGGRRVIRQLLVESVLLASIGGVVGVGLAYGLARLIVSFKPPIPVPIAIDLGIDVRVLTFALGISLLTGIVFGLVPAIKASRTNLVSALKNEVSALRVIGRRWSLRNVLVVGQITISLVLMVVAGLFVKSMRTASEIDVGFDMDQVAMATFSVDAAGYTEEQAGALYTAVLERVAAEPTVTNAAVTNRVPLGALLRSVDVSIDGFEPPPNREATEIDIANISPGYFATLNVPLLEGRDFGIQDADRAQAVAIVSRAAAVRFWNGDALGRTIRFGGPGGDPITIVGVAADTKVRTLGEGARPYLYVPLAQVRDRFVTIMASTRGDPAALRDVLRGAISAVDASVPIQETKTMPQHLGLMLFVPRMGAAVISAFGVLAMLLACLGLYGVVAFAVSTRTRELGIRLALGAQPGRVTGMVMREGLRLVGAGIILGMVFATALTFPLSRVLYGIDALAPSNYLVVGAAFFGVAFLAGFVPARRATRVDPMLSLRQE